MNEPDPLPAGLTACDEDPHRSTTAGAPDPDVAGASSGIPALILLDERTAGLRVATLTLLDRLVVAVHRAGFGSITIVARETPAGLTRTDALGISFRVLPAPPPREGPTLVASSGLLVQARDLRILLEHGGRLATRDGSPLPIGMLPSGQTAWKAALNELPIHAAEGAACRVADSVDAAHAEKILWTSLTSSSDGLVDRVFNRPCGRPLSRLLIRTPVSPNAVSLASIGIGLAAAWFFAIGRAEMAVLGALLFQLSAIVDCIDGDIARVLFKESAFGKWLDLAGDQVVHLSVFAGIAVGLVRSGESPFGFWLGLSAIAGAVLSFAVVVRGMRRPARDRRELLQKMIDSATNRDFSVLVLVLAACGWLEWFLWLAATGSHLFWITALALQPRSGSGRASG